MSECDCKEKQAGRMDYENCSDCVFKKRIYNTRSVTPADMSIENLGPEWTILEKDLPHDKTLAIH